MGKVSDALDDSLIEWIKAQKLFFVATAPREGEHINLSPKGGDSFRVLDAQTVAYLDFTGSGVETIAHLKENGRITFMFTAFEGPPDIVRLFGQGEVLPSGTPGYEELAELFPQRLGARAIIRVRLHRVQNSCGFQVPTFAYTGEREQLLRWEESKGPDGLAAYRAEKNALSIDGLPALSNPGCVEYVPLRRT